MNRTQPEIRKISPEDTYAIRLELLRPGHPIEDAMFPGDRDPETVHFGAFSGEDHVGIATLLRAAFPAQPDVTGAWQLRGMATLPSVQGLGFGRALLAACVEHARSRSAELLWCNARSHAIGFYERAGFQCVGDEFHIEDAGPHFRMWVRP
jgi:GNAT superfamily N-acetyltransferase